MIETAVQFGPRGSLVGVITDPEPGHPSALPLAVIVLNAGLLHRIGPGRLHVHLARRLAGIGVTVMRLDLSGIGDSDARRDSLNHEETVLADAREAMDFLAAARGISHFAFLGLCAGAENAFRIACADARVTGVALIDGYAYRTFGFYLRRYGTLLFSASRWWNFLTGQSASGRKLHSVVGLSQGVKEATRPPAQFPSKPAVRADLQRLVDRGARLLLVYTGGGMHEYYNYPGQFADAFPSLVSSGHTRVEYFPRSDHTFTLLSQQNLLLIAVEDWIRTALAATVHARDRRPSGAR